MARSAPLVGMGKRAAISRRARASSLVVADSISTSASKRGAGLAPIPTSSKKPPSGNEAARVSDVATGGADDVAPWLEAAFWRGGGVSDRYSRVGLCDRPLPEGLGLLWGEPPAKAAPRDRTRRPGMRVGMSESLTA